jgi:pantoate--beta-alanine ligase
MRTIRMLSELRGALAQHRHTDRRIGLVPTMGAFHEGHLSLIRRARSDCDVVVVSLFVNPAQFAPGEDLVAYPRDEIRDAALAADLGADILFAPPVDQVYPDGFATMVAVAGLSETLEGAARGAAHFSGVTTVVAKLFNMVEPDVAFLGQKDAQQALVIERMTRDLDFEVEIVVCPTVREPDGLAMSSRNAYLEPADRRRAQALRRALGAAEAAVADGEQDAQRVADAARAAMEPFGVEPEYLEVVATDTLAPLETIDDEALVAVAATVGQARLIDNTTVRVSAPVAPAARTTDTREITCNA